MQGVPILNSKPHAKDPGIFPGGSYRRRDLFRGRPEILNKVRYIGGTPSIKGGSYDWDATVTIGTNPDTLELVVAPSSAFGHQQKVKLKASQITSVVNGPGAWQRVDAVPGSQLPPKPHGIFGLLNRTYPLVRRPYAYLAILYQDDDGKPAAILLNCYPYVNILLGQSIAALTGKPLVYAK